jgi:hypothetical protein
VVLEAKEQLLCHQHPDMIKAKASVTNAKTKFKAEEPRASSNKTIRCVTNTFHSDMQP